MAAYLARRRAHQAELARALAAPREVAPAPSFRVPRDRPLRLFLSCAEPSGELHAVNLVRALRSAIETQSEGQAPPPELHGLGGERLAAAGVRCVGDPVSRAAMGADAARGVGFYMGLLRAAGRTIEGGGFDAVIPIDSPALHLPLARIARAFGPPVVHFITPQYWGWAPWRVGAYARAVDLALSILPFEPAWFEARGVRVSHVGHPVLDALRDEPTGRTSEAEPDAPPTLAVLPGSRAAVIDRHLPWMLEAAADVRAELAGLRVVLPHARAELTERLQRHIDAAGAAEWARISTEREGGLHATLATATAALSVSGTVLLDLLHHRLPTVVVYRVSGALSAAVSRRLLTVPWFSSVNLLAGAEVCPEFGFHGEGPRTAVADALVQALADPARRTEARSGLNRAAEALGPPGAVDRAAAHILSLAENARP